MLVKLVIPMLLQMDQIESLPYFCAAFEIARDVAEEYIETPVGSHAEYQFVKHAAQEKDFDFLPIVPRDDGKLQYMVEFYVDNFILVAMLISYE